jgi:hypothetical protein
MHTLIDSGKAVCNSQSRARHGEGPGLTDERKPPIRIAQCGNGDDCPALRPGAGGGIEVTGRRLDRPDLPDHEAVVWVPGELLPEVADLVIDDLGAWIGSRHKHDLLRVQTLARYTVASDGEDFERYLRGEEDPVAPQKQAWLDRLAAGVQEGRVRRNVHIVEQPLSDYLRYQFEWCYTFNVAAGQDIRVLDADAIPVAAHLAACGDFTLVEGVDVARNQYAPDGTFLGAVQAPSDTAAALAALGETAWALAVPFTAWWRDHPQYHRATRAG